MKRVLYLLHGVGGFLILCSLACGNRDGRAEFCAEDWGGELDCNYDTYDACMMMVFPFSPYINCVGNPNKYLEPEETEEIEIIEVEPTPTPSPSPTPSRRR